jgi:O-antigen ligase
MVLLMASLPFDFFYSHVILISFALHTFIHVKKTDLKALRSLKILVLSSVLLVTIIATTYTINLPGAFNEWTLRIPILLFPIMFTLNPLDVKKYRSNLLLVLSLTCSLTVFYLFAVALVTIKHYHLPVSALFAEGFTNHNFAGPINIHATFFSFQLLIAVVNFLYLLMAGKVTSKGLKIFYSICCLILIGGIIQLSSKSIVIILFIVVNIVLPYYVLQGVTRTRFIITGLFISITVIGCSLSISTFWERYVTLLKEDISTNKKVLRNSDSRIERWQVAARRIKDKPLAGYGSGSEIELLKDDFYDAKLYSSYLHGLNSHNEYISFLLKSGVWGLLIYLSTIIYGIKVSLKKRDVLFISFMLIVTIVSFTENILDVDKGVMFYSLFFSFFIFSNHEDTTVFKGELKSDDYLTTLATNTIPVTSYY